MIKGSQLVAALSGYSGPLWVRDPNRPEFAYPVNVVCSCVDQGHPAMILEVSQEWSRIPDEISRVTPIKLRAVPEGYVLINTENRLLRAVTPQGKGGFVDELTTDEVTRALEFSTDGGALIWLIQNIPRFAARARWSVVQVKTAKARMRKAQREISK